VATEVLLLVHTPPPIELPRAIVSPAQIAVAPPMTGNGLTVATLLTKQPELKE
jgi:hypothetical protein